MHMPVPCILARTSTLFLIYSTNEDSVYDYSATYLISLLLLLITLLAQITCFIGHITLVTNMKQSKPDGFVNWTSRPSEKRQTL